MPTWLTLARSPLFRFALALLVLGLLRLALLSAWEIGAAARRAGDRRIPYGQILREIAGWIIPVTHIHRTRALFSYASFVFHLGILGSGLFLGGHIDLLEANIGIAWPALNRQFLDILILAATLSGGYLLLHRIYVVNSRKLSNAMDYLLLVILLSIFVSGYLAGQAWNPIPYDGLMLFHTAAGITLLILIPFTKISHCILYPLIRLGTEVAWHFPPRGGSEAVEALYGPEGRRL